MDLSQAVHKVIVSTMNEILIVDVHSFENRILRSFVNIKEDGTLSNSSYSLWNECHAWRLATEEEKQKLFTKMKEQGLRWNAEEKRVEKIRWRAESGKEYYYVGNQGILMVDTEDGHIADANRYKFGNYFHTKEQRRYEIAKDAMNSILTAPVVDGVNPNPSVEDIATFSVRFADALIKELKGGTK